MEKLSDQIRVTDSGSLKPVGIVTLRDSDGNILFSKHNMITNQGRAYIRDCFLKNSGIYQLKTGVNPDKETPDTEVIDNVECYVLKKTRFDMIIIGQGNSVTTSSMTFNDFQPVYSEGEMVYSISFDDFYTETSSQEDIAKRTNFVSFTEEGDPYVAFGAKFTGIPYAPMIARELGIVMATYKGTRPVNSEASTDYTWEKETGSEILFSRVAFDPIPVGMESNFSLDYKLYF